MSLHTGALGLRLVRRGGRWTGTGTTSHGLPTLSLALGLDLEQSTSIAVGKQGSSQQGQEAGLWLLASFCGKVNLEGTGERAGVPPQGKGK